MAVSSLRPDSDSAPGDSATLNLTRSHPLVTRTPTWEIVAKRRKHRIIGDNEDVKKLRFRWNAQELLFRILHFWYLEDWILTNPCYWSIVDKVLDSFWTFVRSRLTVRRVLDCGVLRPAAANV